MKKGFTLIELLVVVAVIGILAAITMRLSSAVSQKAAYAQAVNTLEHVDHWLEEYSSIYGHYPNTTDFSWENPDEGSKPDDWGFLISSDPSINTGLPEGLCKWFNEHREAGLEEYMNQIHQNKGNQDHDDDSTAHGFEYGLFSWTNTTYNLIDPWGREYYYRPNPALQSYNTYSSGPDGIVGNADDVSYEAWTE
jgi:prepilin-type N-terminal cleavage/methylation domain-containing protein